MKLGEPDAALEIRKSGVSTQPIPPWVAVQPDQPMVAPLKGFVEPGEGLVFVIESGIHESDAVRCYVFVTGQFTQVGQNLFRLRSLSPLPISVSYSGDGHDPFR